MKLEDFKAKTDLLSKTEIQKVRLLAYFFLRTKQLEQFTITDVSEWFESLRLAAPNTTRLKERIKGSKIFIRGSLADTFRLHAKEITALDSEYPHLVERSEEVVSGDEVLPESLFIKTRGFIESLSRQINAAYEGNIFDGCAVLMRRLLEILLILSYQANGIESAIQQAGGDYVSLDKIITDATSNKKLDLSKYTKSCLNDFRKLGNFSAHKIYYNAKRADIQKVIIDFRAAIEELLYKAGIKT